MSNYLKLVKQVLLFQIYLKRLSEIEKVYENSVMIRVIKCAVEDNETADSLHWQLVVRKSSAIME